MRKRQWIWVFVLVVMVVSSYLYTSGCAHVSEEGTVCYDAEEINSSEQSVRQERPSVGILMLHGIGSDHHEMNWMAGELTARGYLVDAPNLPGHGTSLSDMRQTSLEEQRTFVSERLRILNDRCDTVIVLGQSMGSMLALDAAVCDSEAVSGVIAISPPIRLFFLRLRPGLIKIPVRAIMPFIPYVPRLCTLVRNPDARDEVNQYPGWSGNAVADVITLIDDVESNLSKVNQPVLIIHSRRDILSHPSGAAVLESNLSNVAETSWIEEGGHIITVDYERERALETVINFLARF